MAARDLRSSFSLRNSRKWETNTGTRLFEPPNCALFRRYEVARLLDSLNGTGSLRLSEAMEAGSAATSALPAPAMMLE